MDANQKTVFQEISRVRRNWTPAETKSYISALPIWEADVSVEQKFGGLRNRTFFVTSKDGKKYAVRVGFDDNRTRQTTVVQCTIAAHTLGVGPRLVYAEPNLTVTDFVEGKGVLIDQMTDPAIIKQIIDRMKILHNGGHAIQETISYCWPFDSVRRYLNMLEISKEATDYQPSKWADQLPRYRDITNRLEKAIAPYIPIFTHNGLTCVNMIFNPKDEIIFVDWDGAGYGHPMFDLGEILMWAEVGEIEQRFALKHYFGELTDDQMVQRLKEIHAFQVIGALRDYTECMCVVLDRNFFLTPEEYAESMKVSIPGVRPELEGFVELLLPRFEQLWEQYEHEFES